MFDFLTGNADKRRAVDEANAKLAELAKLSKQYGLDVSDGGRIESFLSPDVSYRQQAATQGLGQIYGNSGALNSSGAQKGIAGANAQIAAQAWEDAFGRNKSVLDTQLNAETSLGTSMVGNTLAQRMNEQSILGTLAQGFGIAGGLKGLFK